MGIFKNNNIRNMKSSFLKTIALTSLCCFFISAGFAAKPAENKTKLKKEAGSQSFPKELECISTNIYRYCADGKPGREVIIKFNGEKLYSAYELEVSVDGRKNMISIPIDKNGIEQTKITLPSEVGADKDIYVSVVLKSGSRKLEKTFNLPKQKQWTVYIFPHSHVDIGYTNPQDVVETIHMINMNVGIELGKATENYPDGSRHVWNNEVLWAVESWIKRANPEQITKFKEAVKKGQIGLSASYCNANTTVASDEELIHFFAYAKKMRELTGASINTMCQFDVPGMSWGMVQAASQNGIKAILDFPNPSDRTGNIHVWRNKHFWWVAPDGKTRVLYLQIFPYNVAWKLGAFNMCPKPYIFDPWRDRAHFANTSLMGTGDIVPGPTLEDFIRGETAALDKAGSPYDIYPIAWSLSDNAPIDADLPDFVKKWNEIHAYPKLVIASANTIAEAFEKRFGDVIPKVSGDLTEYWTDGLGTDARRVGYNRPAKENLVQSEIITSMLHNATYRHSQTDFVTNDNRYDAWRWIQLGTEHTWGYLMPDNPLAKKVEATKATYFENAKKSSEEVLSNSLKPIVSEGSSKIAVFNTLSWNRTGLVTLSAEQSKGIKSVYGDGKEDKFPCQRLSTGELVFVAKNIPALTSATYDLGTKALTAKVNPMVKENTLENDFVKVELDSKTGDIISCIDKRSGKEMVNKSSPYALNSFRYLYGEDSPDKAFVPTEVKISIKENGPVVASLLVESKAEGCNKLTREIRIIAGQPQIEILNVVDKISTTKKEGIHFGFAFNIPNATTRMDIPWGVMNPLTDQIEGANKNWLACQRWIDISGDEYGVTWASTEASIVEFGDITANLLGGVEKKRWNKTFGDTRTILSWALNNHWHTNFPLEQSGIIPFHYSILPHGAYNPVVANRFGLEQNRPLIAVGVDKNPVDKALVSLDNPKVFISTIKPADDGIGYIVRLRSLSEKAEKVKLSWPSVTPKTIRLSDGMESVGKDVSDEMQMLPNGVITLRILL
jgi:alpha-mannosidase